MNYEFVFTYQFDLKGNTYIRLDLGVDKIKNDIQKSRLKLFGYMIWMAEERIPKKMLHTKIEENDQEKDEQLERLTKLERI